jgi:hypothetical protein
MGSEKSTEKAPATDAQFAGNVREIGRLRVRVRVMISEMQAYEAFNGDERAQE